ncbi:MAG: hypothetical protein GX621_03900 [Pirellulaceae bacterium]|nr:hypothetical protein [Pirellulaceae bacterium]
MYPNQRSIVRRGIAVFLLGLCAACGAAVLGGVATAEDIWDPPWLEDPTDPQWLGGVATYQRWEFDENPAWPVELHNPFGQPYIELGGASYPDPVPGPNGAIINTWHIDEDGGFLHIYVPNDPTPRDRKVIFIQLTSDKGALLGSPVSSPSGTISYPKPAIKHGPTSWYTYTAQIDIPFNPPEEYITYRFPESTNISELVIDTICVGIPEPSTATMLLGVAIAACGLFGIGRRRLNP